VQDTSGNAISTPLDIFVDNDIYADVYYVRHHQAEQAAAASIEAIFITLGSDDLTSRQDAVLFDKFEQIPVVWLNRLLGVNINTRRLAVQIPAEYVTKKVAIPKGTWNKGHYSFIVSDAESITGRLGYIANMSPWLSFVTSFFHVSIARALAAEQAYPIVKSRDFCDILRAEKKGLKNASDIAQGAGAESSVSSARLPGTPSQHDAEMRYRCFAVSNTAKKVHHSRTIFLITKSM
jgi:hypothetical protein